MNLLNELQRIYNSEINFSISSFWDGGFDVKLGDERNGFVSETSLDNFNNVVLWLIEEVLEKYPKSVYSKIRIELINRIRSGLVDTDKFTKEFLSDVVLEYEKKHPGIYLELLLKLKNHE